MKQKKINDWTYKKEKLLRFWQEECRLYNWLYTQNTQHYEFINKGLSISSILLSAITGTTLINNSECDSNTNTIILVFGIISILNTFIQGAKEFLNLPEKINLNINAARQNNSIIMDIDEQININATERINGKEFLKSIKFRKNELIQNGPVIPRICWKRLSKKISKGENINFFNNHIFQEYLDQTVNINKLDFHEENINNSDSNQSDSSSNKSDIIDISGQECNINNNNKLNNNINENDENYKYNENDENYKYYENNEKNKKYNNNSNYIVNENKLNETNISYTSGSEDEFLNDVKNNNMCKQQLEFNLKKNNLQNNNTINNNLQKSNINNKFDTQLQYQMSRI